MSSSFRSLSHGTPTHQENSASEAKMAEQLRHLIEVEKVPKPYNLHPKPYTFSEDMWCLVHSTLSSFDKDCMCQFSQLSLSLKRDPCCVRRIKTRWRRWRGASPK